MSIPEFLLDKRVVERNIAKGLIKRDDLKTALGALKDVESNSEPCSLEAIEEETEEEAPAPAET